MKRLSIAVFLLGVFWVSGDLLAQKGKKGNKPHAVFVVGTPHYNPAATMPPLAEALKSMGFRTTVVQAEGNPEKSEEGIPGLEVLSDADVAVFYLRFLTLPDDQLKHITDYVESGKPVVGFRTSTHAFAYRQDDPRANWNDGFGRDVLGSKYFIHLAGTTDVEVVPDAEGHPILTGYQKGSPIQAAGTLYLAEIPADATPLLNGTGRAKRIGTITNGFGTHEIAEAMTDVVAWTWKNRWGGRVFTTTIGHAGSFADANLVRLFLNGIIWASGKEVPNIDAKNIPMISVTERNQTFGDSRDRRKAKEEQGAIEENGEGEFTAFGIYEETAPLPAKTSPVDTSLPLKLERGDRVALIGNTLLDRSSGFGYFETLLHQGFPEHRLVVRNLAWSADEVDIQTRPEGFGTLDQHLTVNGADVIIAAFGFNESFAGVEAIPDFKQRLTRYLVELKSNAYNGESGPRIVLVSPIANENVEGVPAGDLNNERLVAYTRAMAEVALELKVGFVDVFGPMKTVMEESTEDLTFNGVHLVEPGYRVFGEILYESLFGEEAPEANERLRGTVVDKNKQYFYRYRPLNTFYYTGGRNKRYGYLDFLPAMRNFDIMVANRDQRIWDIAAGRAVPEVVDDSNVPALPEAEKSRGGNEWLTPEDELAAFDVDPRFEVNCFASEEDFPEIACPIQMRWDSLGRLWVSCSTTYPHVYPGNAPNDKIVILEDTDWDGKADKSTVFADNLEIPLSFEFGDGGVYVSEEPHLSFLKDTDGDGEADYREQVLTGFGCEDSHHALHDFVWTPDGDLLFRESIFHTSQVETPYGPIRVKNSAWFRYTPRNQKLITFGSYPNTNPWGVTYDEWGNHVASHPIFASAFHALNPPYPEQHPKAAGIPAYSGVCGHEFVDFASWPEEMQGGKVKVRYKPTNRVEFHKWVEHDDHFSEEYQGDIIFSKNLSFIPVDVRFGPRGGMYVCDWYNPIKGHAQYSLRDDRRDRKSGRIWRIVPKGAKLQEPPKIAGEPIPVLLDLLKAPEYRYRYWAKRELRERDEAEVKAVLDEWVAALDESDERYRHHQLEGLWMYRNIGAVNVALLEGLLGCDNHLARAAATRQIRYWHEEMEDCLGALNDRANDESGLVRLEAAIAASYIGTKDALLAMLDVTKHPTGDHLKFAIATSLGSEALSRHWRDNVDLLAANPGINDFLKAYEREARIKGQITTKNANDANFDSQRNLKVVEISCVPERMLYTVNEFEVEAGQPVKLIFTNPDVTPHNLIIAQPGSVEELGIAANEMAKDPKGLEKGFLPDSDKVMHHTPMLNQDEGYVLRFMAPEEADVYPFLCTFPGHWIVMKGEMVVK
ncbi:MAG: PVC-type heme-binding CxxCH protein [Verrucomicrobiota bacterium]